MTEPVNKAHRAAFHAATECVLPSPGGGRTAERFAALFDIARNDLEVARLAEAHHDAVAIAHELGGAARPRARYGVWAASGPHPLRATPIGGGYQLAGTVPWCTGVGVVDRALVSAATPEGPLLVDVAVSEGVATTEQPWVSPAFAWTGTQSLRFVVDVRADAVLGDVGAYLTRPGFWHGAVGVAACWAGGLAGLVDLHLRRWKRRDPHAIAHLGSAASWSQCAIDVLRVAADDIDRTPDDVDAAHARARHVRHVVERACLAAMTDLAVGAGPEPLAYDQGIVRRTQQLELYIRQCHGERDLEPLGSSLLDGAAGSLGPLGTRWPDERPDGERVDGRDDGR